MSLKSKFTARSRKSVQRTVDGVELNFYPNQVLILQDLQTLSGPLSKALGILFRDQRNDVATRERKMPGERKGEEMQEWSSEAVDVNLAELRDQQTAESIEAVIGLLTQPATRLVVGKAIMDSLRDEFPRQHGGPDMPAVEKFLDGDEEEDALTIPQLTQLVVGWVSANAMVFGELGKQVVGLMENKLRLVRPANSDSVQTRATSGSDSTTPSPEQSSPDSTGEKSSS